MIAIVALSSIVLLLSASAPKTTHAEPPPFVVGSVLYEDLNGSGVLDEGDAPPATRAAAFFTSFEDPQGSGITLYTAPDGGFQFTNIPPGSYSVRIYWPTGFLAPPSSTELSHILQAAFEVSTDGGVSEPLPAPATWPGTGAPYDPDTAGPLPPTILLARNSGFITVPTEADFNAIAVGEGSIDVGEAIRNAGATPTPEPPFVQDTAVVRPEQTPTPTPALPEEGGPPGGVISGYVYVDLDGSRSRSFGDEPGQVTAIHWDTERNQGRPGGSVSTESDGSWELRALADGVYRINSTSTGMPKSGRAPSHPRNVLIRPMKISTISRRSTALRSRLRSRTLPAI